MTTREKISYLINEVSYHMTFCRDGNPTSLWVTDSKFMIEEVLGPKILELIDELNGRPHGGYTLIEFKWTNIDGVEKTAYFKAPTRIAL